MSAISTLGQRNTLIQFGRALEIRLEVAVVSSSSSESSQELAYPFMAQQGSWNVGFRRTKSLPSEWGSC